MLLNDIILTLKKRRITLVLTQERLAELADISLRTIKEIESGKGNPTFATLSKIADVLGMEIKLEVKHPIT